MNIFIFVFLAIISLILIFKFTKIPSRKIFAGVVGLILGLLIGVLIRPLLPVSKLSDFWATWLPLLITTIACIGTIILFNSLSDKIFQGWKRSLTLLKKISEIPESFRKLYELRKSKIRKKKKGKGKEILGLLVDTSVIIDGRLEEIINTGFLLSGLIVPKFVISELQEIADSKNSLKRERGKRGLEILRSIRKSRKVKTQILSNDYKNIKGVDTKLIQLAKEKSLKILTTDYNLNRVAEIQNIQVLNINELANALKPEFIPGEVINVKIIEEGQEKKQGVGYLPDGTMIVVEDGAPYLGEKVNCKVERLLQTNAGRIVFVKPE